MEDNDDDFDDDDDDFEAIPVHKHTLVARSGVFREMFQNLLLNENVKNTNSVQDYSNKTIESLEIFVKYLYTSKIELTGGEGPQMIVEVLEDSIEYYQLNKNSNL
ncbi:kelch-like protein [Anaeramoeba flamelloides]|uniref:Kelch-like protein n=1 Tax=Anaeramoeba flamelloides TaxID=1746091 RepID=A0AAV7ZRG2_9EUKA|nr:kelch-like protein [Anaeramoeba flamelloides]